MCIEWHSRAFHDWSSNAPSDQRPPPASLPAIIAASQQSWKMQRVQGRRLTGSDDVCVRNLSSHACARQVHIAAGQGTGVVVTKGLRDGFHERLEVAGGCLVIVITAIPIIAQKSE